MAGSVLLPVPCHPALLNEPFTALGILQLATLPRDGSSLGYSDILDVCHAYRSTLDADMTALEALQVSLQENDNTGAAGHAVLLCCSAWLPRYAISQENT